MRLLIAEDDPQLLDSLVRELRAEGFVIDTADNGREAQYLGDEIEFDAVVLDLGLPQIDGLSVLRHWRAGGRRVPVLILTARGAWHEKVEGFKAGADDYLAKPFHVEELVERLRALIRRAGGLAGPMLECDGLRLDESTRQLQVGELPPLQLTGTEFRLLHYFMRHPGQVLTKTRLTEHLYDQNFDRDSNLIEVYVRRLRDKIGRQRIETQRGQGYVFRARQA